MGGFIEMLRGLGPIRLGIIGLVAAAMIGFFVFIGVRVTAPQMALLYGNLDLQEAGQITTRLDGLKIPYRIANNGTEILVPEPQVQRLRMTLAQAGLPSGGSVGYELFDKSDQLGATSFVQQINQVRALEGELARSIRGIDNIQAARVHLVLPKREVFTRDVRPPSASIILKVRGRLDTPQVRAIQNLVAAAVPDLKPSRISVVDERGNLLAGGQPEAEEGQTAEFARMTELRRQQEKRLREAVESLLERSVGIGNVRAEVTADIDYDRVTTNSEEFNPDGQVVRSTQNVAEQNQTTEGQQAVTVAGNLPENQGNGGTQSQQSGNRTEETINYEISKTTRNQVREGGQIRRLSVAVLVNGTSTQGENGQRTFQPRSEEELRRLTQLVRSAVGYDERRGDVVDVVSMPFTAIEDMGAPTEQILFLGMTKDDLFRLGSNLMLGLLFVLVLLLVVRPILMRLLGFNKEDEDKGGPQSANLGPGVAMPAGMAGGLAQLVGPNGELELPPGGDAAALLGQAQSNLEQMIDIARIDGQVKASSLKKIGEIVEKHPDEAVAIVRNWLYAE